MTFTYVDSPKMLSHSYIISRGSEKHRLSEAMRIASAAVCRSEDRKPCGSCRACRKAQSGMHPDISIIRRLTDDKGKTKKFVSVDQVREMRDDSLIAPNESDYKVYIIAEGEKLNTEAQNAALKLLEEPPEGVIIIICTDNEANLLVTVRSRCTLLRCSADDEESDSSGSKKAEAYFDAAASQNPLALPDYCMSVEKLTSEAMDELIAEIAAMAGEMIAGRKDRRGMSLKNLLHIYELMKRIKSMRVVNVSAKTIAGILMVDSLPENE